MLVLAATPIGRVADAPPRLAEELATADVVAAEDTRRLQAADHRPRGHASPAGWCPTSRATSPRARRSLVEALLAGERVLLVTDAGMPQRLRPRLPAGRGRGRGRHPGHRRARARPRCSPRWPSPGCRSTGSASRASCPARPASGPGGWPRWPREERTMVFFEAPHRTEAALAAMAEAFGADRPRGGLPRADQDPRGGTPRPARRARRLGRRGRPRRGDDRGRRAPPAAPTSTPTPTACCAAVADARGRGHHAARRRSSRWPGGPGCPSARSTTWSTEGSA